MIRTLLSMLNDEQTLARLVERANRLYSNYSNTVSNVVSNVNATFEEEGASYVLVLNVPETLTSSDVNVEFDDDTNALTVEYEYKTDHTTYSMSMSETLPEDADVDTLSATVTNGVFTVVVDKLPEPAEEIVEPEATVDPVIVTIKRKRKE